MERDNTNMHQPGADRTGSNRFKDDESDTKDVREANENIRKAQGDDSMEKPDDKSGNRPRFDRDR